MTSSNFPLRLLTLALLTGMALSACQKEQPATAEHGEAKAEHEAPKSSSAGLPGGDVANGEKLAHTKQGASNQSCVECHGKEGAAPIDPTYPVIAGQYEDYIGHALVAYRTGTRGNAVMAGQAGTLNDQQIADLSAYFSSRATKLVDLSDQ